MTLLRFGRDESRLCICQAARNSKGGKEGKVSAVGALPLMVGPGPSLLASYLDPPFPSIK